MPRCKDLRRLRAAVGRSIPEFCACPHLYVGIDDLLFRLAISNQLASLLSKGVVGATPDSRLEKSFLAGSTYQVSGSALRDPAALLRKLRVETLHPA